MQSMHRHTPRDGCKFWDQRIPKRGSSRVLDRFSSRRVLQHLANSQAAVSMALWAVAFYSGLLHVWQSGQLLCVQSSVLSSRAV